jgi:hypothetical protein
LTQPRRDKEVEVNKQWVMEVDMEKKANIDRGLFCVLHARLHVCPPQQQRYIYRCQSIKYKAKKL